MFFIIILLALVSMPQNEQELRLQEFDDDIIKIHFYCRPWFDDVDFSSNSLPNISLDSIDRYTQIILKRNYIYFKSIKSSLENKELYHDSLFKINPKIICILYKQSEKPDTLCFGDKKFQCYYLNNKCYNFNWILFDRICNYLPNDQKILIDESTSFYKK